MSTYQPQPGVDGDPSRSQPWLAGTTLHRTTTTTPADAARIGVPRAAPRSTPLCIGRPGVRNPDTTGARTGAIHSHSGGAEATADGSPDVAVLMIAGQLLRHCSRSTGIARF